MSTPVYLQTKSRQNAWNCSQLKFGSPRGKHSGRLNTGAGIRCISTLNSIQPALHFNLSGERNAIRFSARAVLIDGKGWGSPNKKRTHAEAHDPAKVLLVFFG